MRKALSLVVLLFVLAACGREGSRAAGPYVASAKFPVTVTTSSGVVTIPKRPVRVVSLSPTATEMLFAIRAGDQVVAVDDQSNYPTDAPKTKLSGFKPNVEAVATYKPDLVVYSNESGGLAASLRSLKIPAIVQPAAATLNDTYTQISQLGDATGHSAEASRLNNSIKDEIRGIVSDARKFGTPPTYYHELDKNLFTVTSKTFIGQLYGLLGLRNIADAADKAGTGYPQLSAEYIIHINPAFIFLADTKCCNESAATVSRRPGWSGIAAVRNVNVVGLDDDIASRWGPRVVDFLRTVSKVLKDAEEL